MAQSVTLFLPEETLQRYRRGATAARKLLEEFLVERLLEAIPLSADNLQSPLQEELHTLEHLNDAALWQVVRSQLSPARQRLYSRLLTKNSQGTITAQEKKTLHSLGEQARLLTLKVAHAHMVLKWRGRRVHSPDELQKPK